MAKKINDPNQIAAEIDNQGFGYWVQNYAEKSLRDEGSDELAEIAKKACELLDLLQAELNAQEAIWQ